MPCCRLRLCCLATAASPAPRSRTRFDPNPLRVLALLPLSTATTVAQVRPNHILHFARCSPQPAACPRLAARTHNIILRRAVAGRAPSTRTWLTRMTTPPTIVAVRSRGCWTVKRTTFYDLSHLSIGPQDSGAPGKMRKRQQSKLTATINTPRTCSLTSGSGVLVCPTCTGAFKMWITIPNPH